MVAFALAAFIEASEDDVPAWADKIRTEDTEYKGQNQMARKLKARTTPKGVKLKSKQFKAMLDRLKPKKGQVSPSYTWITKP